MTTGSWTDTSTGVSETAAFISSAAGLVLVHAHIPASPAQPPVVICSSVYEELRNNYRREVLLARRLAAAGAPVVRFQYRGFGNSDDAPGAGPTFDTLR
jgi:pimeloyl-ACP methyl ester carboxylesterase